MDKITLLSTFLLIGKGSHKKVYTDPTNANRCIKILRATPDYDMERELRYRGIREKRQLVSSLLPAYYGTVHTNLGLGYVFDRITDFDGYTSKSLRQIFDAAESDAKPVPFLADVLRGFKTQLFQELIVTSDVDPSNFLLQRISDTQFRVRIVDNIGSSAFLPLVYYFDVIAKKRVKKYWRRFLDETHQNYPYVLTDEVKLDLW